MIIGSALQCLRDEVYVPLTLKTPRCVQFQGVEAYGRVERRALDKPFCAAGPFRPDIGFLSYHSIMQEEDCVFEFDAIRFAAELHLECLQQDAEDVLDSLQSVQGLAPQDRDCGSDNEIVHDDYHVPVHGNDGHIHPMPSVIPLRLRPYWIQELATDFAQWLQAIGTNEPELKVRTWYLHPDRFSIWRSPRPIHFSANTDYWENDLRAVWHDVLEHELAVDVHLVHPAPERGPHDMGYFADIILGQNLDEWSTALFVTQFAGNPRAQIRTQAHLVPGSLHKWEAFELADVSRICGGPSFPLDHYRVCQLFHGNRQIGALPVDLHLGDCLHFLIYPPTIDDSSDSDEAVLLTSFPTSVRVPADVTRLSSGYALSSRRAPGIVDHDATSLLAAHALGQQHPQPPLIDNEDIALSPERLPIDGDEEMHDYDEPPEELDSPTPDEEGPDQNDKPKYAAIVYLIHSPPVRLRLAFGNRNLFYATIANAIQVPDQAIVFLHSIAAPPEDLVEGHTTPMIAQLNGELTPGSIHRYVLIDIEFHANLPTLAPEVDRSTKLIPKQLTRDQVLRILGIHSYCFRATQGRQRCLMWHNGQLVSGHRLHHLNFNHGDYIKIALPPDHTVAESFTTRELAAICYNGDALYADLGDAGRELMADVLPDIPPDTPIVYALPAVFHEGEEDSAFMQITNALDKPSLESASQPLERFQLPQFERHLQDDIAALLTCETQHPSQRFPVHSWYLDHERHPRQRAARVVFLGADPTQWRSLLLEAWHDCVRHDLEAIFHGVKPHPFSDLGGDEVHIIITQNPLPGLASLLLSTSFPAPARGFRERMAIAFTRITTQEDVFDEVDCESSDLLQHFVCERVHLGATVASPSLIYPLRDGLHIVVDMGFKTGRIAADQGNEFDTEVSATIPYTISNHDDDATFLQVTATLQADLSATLEGPLRCKTNEDLHTVREQIRGLAERAEQDQDRRILEELAALEPVLRDLHGLWLRIAVPWQGNTLWAPVSVWFISHLHWRICTAARIAWLS